MSLSRYWLVLVFLAFAACLVTYGAVSAQGGEKSLPELSAQAQKIKVGETTEAEVISLLGQPSKTSERMVSRTGARDIKGVKKLFYGPENNIVVLIDQSTGKVEKVNFKPAR
jgi:hypothetical protein